MNSSVVKKHEVFRFCAVCDRTLLMGEQTVRFSPSGDGHWVDVCALCTDVANEHGWLKEGTPTTPLVADTSRRRGLLGRARNLIESRRAEPEPVVPPPVLRRLSPDEQAIVEAAERFNETAYPRTVAGIAKSLGEPRISLLPLSGVNPEVVITIAWEISWYQYRVVFESAQPVRLEERGHDFEEIEPRFRTWNASLDGGGRITPDIPRF